MESAREHWPGLIEVSGIEAGLQTIGWLRDGIDADDAARAAAERNVEVTPLRWKRDGLKLGFAAVDAREIRRGVRDLANALRAARVLKKR